MLAHFPILARVLLWTAVALVWLIVTPAVSAQLPVNTGFPMVAPAAGSYKIPPMRA